jgi:hypothetical protein
MGAQEHTDMTLSSLFQQAMASPAVKKLRALEEARMARVTAKHAARRQRLTHTLQQADVAVKAELAEYLETQADQARAQAQDLQELSEILKTLTAPQDQEDDE